MNIDGNNFEYTGENINLLDSIEIDDLYLIMKIIKINI